MKHIIILLAVGVSKCHLTCDKSIYRFVLALLFAWILQEVVPGTECRLQKSKSQGKNLARLLGIRKPVVSWFVYSAWFKSKVCGIENQAT